MFVYYFLHVDRAFEAVEPQLLRMLPGLRGWASDAYREGERLHARISTGSERPAIAKRVTIDVGEPVRGAGETWIPVRWEATGAPGLFPTMDADIIVAWMGGELTQLSLRGSYRVPLGPVGRALDRVLLHRVAEASVKSFVDAIGRALERDLAVDAGPIDSSATV